MIKEFKFEKKKVSTPTKYRRALKLIIDCLNFVPGSFAKCQGKVKR